MSRVGAGLRPGRLISTALFLRLYVLRASETSDKNYYDENVASVSKSIIC